jgi:hypothetical protein
VAKLLTKCPKICHVVQKSLPLDTKPGHLNFIYIFSTYLFKLRMKFRAFWAILPYSQTDADRLIALMMEATRICETSVDICLTIRQNIPEDSELHTRRSENMKSHIFKLPF